jgi:7-carboxy-7-deazaguanine synthase
VKISEIFASHSGEGMTQGYPTIFVRTIGCNLACTWCDTEYAKKGGEDRGLSDVLTRIKELQPIRHVFFTGGEPLLHLQDIQGLVDMLTPYNYYFTIKTNGAMSVMDLLDRHNVSFAVDVKCPSSGMSDKMAFENYSMLREQDELLYACADMEDLTYAIDHHRHIVARYNCKAQPCFSPVWAVPKEKGDEEYPRVGQSWWQEMAAELLASGPYNGKYSLQLHKCIYGTKRKGV